MGSRKQDSRLEMVRDAATGYIAVVLGIVCFILVLAAIMAGMRVVVETGLIGSNTGNAAVATTAATAASGSGLA